ncbi:MAG: glycosyltransferase family A protein [Methanosarcinaceae archaeon]|nr:glycosyltransferase family A protein [Methanosarcinaceae archaeon]MDD4331638.1 glycosyltransferase family A protein [Methanosarcinaceae archaeon]MDD4748475.1 glycosyltransferase family A protein [Methanosarcinaceae archaeon]
MRKLNRIFSKKGLAAAPKYISLTGKKTYYGYFYKNTQERRKNRELLKKRRIEAANKSLEQGYTRKEKPLVSIITPTYNRIELLAERAIPSALNQTYKNIEIIIVGDHCTDETENRIKSFKDPRIKFYNLPKRSRYPKDPNKKWYVHGAKPRNVALELAAGEWIAPLDDDDEFSKDHIESLLNYALENNYEMVYGRVAREIAPGEWSEVGSYPLKPGEISLMSVLYHSRLNFIKWSSDSWKYEEPTDWNLWRRIEEAGARIGFLDKVVGTHYIERVQIYK